MIMDSEITAAIEDFEEALQDGAEEALRALQSWSAELSEASPEDLTFLFTRFSEFLEQGKHEHTPSTWEALAALREFLATLVNNSFQQPSSAYASQLLSGLKTSWQCALGSVVLNHTRSSFSVHLSRVHSLQKWLPEAALGAISLLENSSQDLSQLNRARRAIIQATLYSLALSSTPPQLAHDLERLLEATTLQCSNDQETSILQLTQAMQGAFEAAVDTIQNDAIIHTVGHMSSTDQEIYWSQAWNYLSGLKRSSGGGGSNFNAAAAVRDAWWGTFASVAHQLAVAVTQHGSRVPALGVVINLLCRPESASMLLQCLLANPACAAEGTKGARTVFKTAGILLKNYPRALISACCDIMAPYMNAQLAIRMEALLAILKAQQNCREVSIADLWDLEALNTLIFALNRDSSVRIRRRVIEIVEHMCRKLSSTGGASSGDFEESGRAGEIVGPLGSALAQRCFDQDSEVRKGAYAALLLIPFDQLEASSSISIGRWQRVLAAGLAAEHEELGGISGKHAKEITAASKQLLRVFLRKEVEKGQGKEKEGTGRAVVMRLHDLIAAGGSRGDGRCVSKCFIAALSEIITCEDLLRVSSDLI